MKVMNTGKIVHCFRPAFVVLYSSTVLEFEKVPLSATIPVNENLCVNLVVNL